VTDYHYMAEQIFNESRRSGSTFWSELSLGQRDHWADIARAAERFTDPDPNEYWCPDCDEYRDEVRDLQDVVELREREIETLKEKLANP
jgi:hypothetical protein